MTSSSASADRALALALGTAACVLGLATPARAQSRTGFAVSRFEPAERGSPYFVLDPLDFRTRAHPAVGASFDYAHKPLVVEDAAGSERFALVRHQLFVHAGASVAVAGRVRFGLDLPFAAHQDGESVVVAGAPLKAATAPALGDARVAIDVRALGRQGDAFVLGAGVRAWAPTGVRSQFTSDGAFRIAPQLLAGGDVGRFSWAARAAVIYRARDDAYAGAALGSELFGAAGGGVRLLDRRLFVGPELWASSVFSGDSFLGARETPANAVLGAHYDIGPVRVSAGVGTGLLRGYGAPRLRALFSVEWAPEREPPIAVSARPPPPEPEAEPVPASTAPRPLAVATTTEIRIGERIQFATGSAELLADSEPVLWAVKRILDERPEIRKVRVEGHTDDLGDPAYNDALSARRAEAVTRWLTEHGVDPSRLESKGYGKRRPIDDSATEASRAKNRRVVFTILDGDRATLEP